MRCLIVCLLALSTVLAFPADTDSQTNGQSPSTGQGASSSTNTDQSNPVPQPAAASPSSSTNTDQSNPIPQPAAASPSQGSTGGCPGGYQEGAEITRQRLVYACRGGQIVPAGCIAENLSKIPVGQTYDNTHYRRRCEQKGSELTFDAVACVANGQEHKAGDTWDDGTQFYTCKSNGVGNEPELQAVSQGCVDGGKRINAGETVPKGDVVQECKPAANHEYKLAPGGCVKDGKQLKPGDSVDDGKFWFNCTLYGRQTIRLKAAGCVTNGKRINDGDKFPDGDVLYECRIDNTENHVVATACITRDSNGGTVERKLGCYFTEGQGAFQTEYQCKHDPAANTATKVPTRCVYSVGNGAYNVEPGCYRVIDNSTFGCIQQGNALNLQSFQGTSAESSAQGAGLKVC